MHSKIALIAALTGLIALFGAAAGKAQAATQYADDASAKSTGSCTDVDDPCTLNYGLTLVSASDDLVLLPGDYTLNTSGSFIGVSGTVRGQAGQPRPTIRQSTPWGNNCNCPALSLYGSAARLKHLKVVQEVTSISGAIGMSEASFIEDSVIEGWHGAVYTFNSANSQGGITNSTLRGMSGVSTGLDITSGSDIDLVQSSVYGNVGVRVDGITASPAGATVRNSIVRGATDAARMNSTGAGGATATFDHSAIDFADIVKTGTGAVSTDLGGNVASANLVDAAGGNFHQIAGSPTIDAGIAPFSGTDLDGDALGLGLAVDIGADEFVPAPVDTSAGGGPAAAPAAAPRTLGGLTLRLSKIRRGRITATLGCPKSAVGACAGQVKVKQGRKTRAVTFTGVAPGKTRALRIKAKKGKATFTVIATDAAGASGSAASSRKLR